MEWSEFEKEHVWHPYSVMQGSGMVWKVASGSGVRITLADGQELIDGMASWWCAIHGYNHPALNNAITAQLGKMAHVMFGGLTHQPASDLARTLLDITHPSLNHVFFSDSGSVSVEVAIKMAIQYWRAKGKPGKTKLATIRGGYHGDTFGAMAVCDPVGGMHHLFSGALTQHFFADAPTSQRDEDFCEEEFASLRNVVEQNEDKIAAIILEPIVQGAGGMRFYAPEYLRKARALCDEYNILLILDEIATGFGRTGRLFAYEQADVAPDILCVGKALTGGYMTLAATIATTNVAKTISAQGPLMHGPTFMANPLACAVAKASVDLLLASPWQTWVSDIETALSEGLKHIANYKNVKDVRVSGAIGVVELNHDVDMDRAQKSFVEKGVWIRPFRNLIYIMPPYIIEMDDLAKLMTAMDQVAQELG